MGSHFSQDYSPVKNALQDPNVLVIDCRSNGEYQDGTAYEGSVNIPVGETASRIGELGEDKNRPIITYCAVGVRAAMAADIIREKEFLHVYSVPNAGTLRKIAAR